MNLRVFLVVALTLGVAFIVGDLMVVPRVETPRSVAAPTVDDERAPTFPMERDVAATVQPPIPAVANAPTKSDDDDVAGPPPVEVTFGPPVWDVQIHAATAREKDATARAKALLALLPNVPVEALAEIAEKAVDGLPDGAYLTTAAPIVTNPATAGQAMSVLFADLMERPDAITLPTLLQIARNPQHPFSPSAVDNLKLLLRVDRGNDWAAWEKDVQRFVAGGR